MALALMSLAELTHPDFAALVRPLFASGKEVWEIDLD